MENKNFNPYRQLKQHSDACQLSKVGAGTGEDLGT